MNRMMNPQAMMPGSVVPNPTVPNLEGVLYVGNLNPNVNEYQLFELFSQYGRPQLVRLMRDAYTGESRRFAFVSYSTKDEATKARDGLNYSKIYDREIRVCFKRSPGEFKAAANVFIKNLEEGVTTKILHQETEKFGNVLSCIVRLDENGNSLRYGYVQFDSEEASKKTIEGLNGKQLHGSEWSVNEFVPRKNRSNIQKKNLYVKNFPSAWTKEEVEAKIEELFGAQGTITSKGVFESTVAGSSGSKFFAFIAYDTEEEAAKAIESLNNKELDGKTESDEPFFVDYAQPKKQRKEMLKKKHLTYQSVTNLYIKSLVESVTEEQVRNIFSKWGKITSICVRDGKPSISKPLKFAFVNFATPEEASVAYSEAKVDEDLKALIDPSHFENVEYVYYAQPKAMRMQYLRMKQKNKMALQMSQLSMMGGMPGMGMMGRGKHPMKGRRNMTHDGPGSSSSGSGMGGFPSMNPMMNMGMSPMMNDPNQMNMLGMGGFPNMGFSNPMAGFNPQMGAMSGSNMSYPGSTASGQQNSTSNAQSDLPSAFLNSLNQTSTMNANESSMTQTNSEKISWLKNSKKEFMALSEEEQKNILGNIMYQRVNESGIAENEMVPKITGMLIDLEILEYEEIIEILENNESLKDRIAEAIEVMNDSN
jgi:polyadenylate-binding protein